MLVFHFVALIIPLAIYFLILGAVNRRERPLMVSGPWDFAGVLFAASGFLLSVGPSALSALYERWRFDWLLGQGASGDSSGGGATYYFWLGMWMLYYGIIVGGAAYILQRRKQLTAVYNVDLGILETILYRVFERLGISCTRNGNYFSLKSSRQNANPATPLLELESFPSLCHATLRWHTSEDLLRQSIEMQVSKELSEVVTPYNPAAGWFLTLATVLLFAALLGFVFLIWAYIRMAR